MSLPVFWIGIILIQIFSFRLGWVPVIGADPVQALILPVRTLVLGGVRSGKSGVGEELLAGHSEVRYIATGPTLTSDAEWVARVEEHRRRRDSRYTTVETTDSMSSEQPR